MFQYAYSGMACWYEDDDVETPCYDHVVGVVWADGYNDAMAKALTETLEQLPSPPYEGHEVKVKVRLGDSWL